MRACELSLNLRKSVATSRFSTASRTQLDAHVPQRGTAGTHSGVERVEGSSPTRDKSPPVGTCSQRCGGLGETNLAGGSTWAAHIIATDGHYGAAWQQVGGEHRAAEWWVGPISTVAD